MCYPAIKNPDVPVRVFLVVQAERLELSHLAALDPKFGIYCTKQT